MIAAAKANGKAKRLRLSSDGAPSLTTSPSV
jgi:hypothetical protein